VDWFPISDPRGRPRPNMSEIALSPGSERREGRINIAGYPKRDDQGETRAREPFEQDI
jgi:hypothetical protein